MIFCSATVLYQEIQSLEIFTLPYLLASTLFEPSKHLVMHDLHFKALPILYVDFQGGSICHVLEKRSISLNLQSAKLLSPPVKKSARKTLKVTTVNRTKVSLIQRFAGTSHSVKYQSEKNQNDFKLFLRSQKGSKFLKFLIIKANF